MSEQSTLYPAKAQAEAAHWPQLQHAARLGVSFRSERNEDRPFLEALYRSTREAELDRTPWNDAQKQAFIAMQFAAQHRHYHDHYPEALWLVLQHLGVPVGRLYLERWSKEHRIIDIALLPQQRGSGIGGAVLTDLMEEAAAAGKAVSIHVEKENPAMRLYRRLGFTKTEDKGVYDLLSWSAKS
jgi:ribosomal protein S18 acetylase RimI-like enzyme